MRIYNFLNEYTISTSSFLLHRSRLQTTTLNAARRWLPMNRGFTKQKKIRRYLLLGIFEFENKTVIIMQAARIFSVASCGVAGYLISRCTSTAAPSPSMVDVTLEICVFSKATAAFLFVVSLTSTKIITHSQSYHNREIMLPSFCPRLRLRRTPCRYETQSRRKIEAITENPKDRSLGDPTGCLMCPDKRPMKEAGAASGVIYRWLA